MKKLLSIALTLLLILNLIPFAYGSTTTVTVLVNEQKVVFADQFPYIDSNNRTLVPVRFVSEALGADVEWENSTRTVLITKGDKLIQLKIGESKATVNNQVKFFDTKAVINHQRTMVPLRFVSEVLGAAVQWLPQTKTVKITVNNGYTLPDKTDLMIEIDPPDDNPNNVDISIIILMYKDIDQQINDVRTILESKFSKEISQQVIDYILQKQNRRDELEYKEWTAHGKTITVASNAGSLDISLLVYAN